MNEIWDHKSDIVVKGDDLREVFPITKSTYKDHNDFIHFFFSKTMFDSYKYVIPSNDFELFQKFINGGSREYPSDGSIPVDLVARETRYILRDIIKISKNSKESFNREAIEVLKNGRFGLVRGTIKLYLGKYTTRDWRRKRFTDDIDFWVYKINLLEHVLKKNGWLKNNNSKEWEKSIGWKNLFTDSLETHSLIASNDVNLSLDFGDGSYLNGPDLKDIFMKKIKRGHNVDLSDIINVAMVFSKAEGYSIDEWYRSWEAFEESSNTRNTRITSNIISIVRHSYAIADYISRVGNVLKRLHNLIFDNSLYPLEKIGTITKVSIHWRKYLKRHGVDLTRELIHNYILEQAHLKVYYSKNLFHFSDKLLLLLNSKFKHLKVVFEIDKE